MKLIMLTGVCMGAVWAFAACTGRFDLGETESATGGSASKSGGNGPGIIEPGAGMGGTGGAFLVPAGPAGGTEILGSTGGKPPIDTSVGGAPSEPRLGTLGAGCILGGLAVEAAGTVAEAEVRTLDHCDEGLSCNRARICVLAAQPCAPNTGEGCLVYQSSGAGGGGNIGSTGGLGNTGGAQGVGSLVPSNVAITGLAANASTVYFTRYGTRDALGNYNNDGALIAHSPADGSNTIVASSLPGPTGFGITTTYAYLSVDNGSRRHQQIMRIPLTGGTPELVQDNRSFGSSFFGYGSAAFWIAVDYDTGSETSYTMRDSDTAPTMLPSMLAFPESGFTADAQNLYYTVANNSISRVPLEGGTPQMVAAPSCSISVHQGSLYGLENSTNGGILTSGVMLVQVPVTGGCWRRVRGLGAGNGWDIKIVGNRFFLTGIQHSTETQSVLTGTLTSEDPPLRVAERKLRGGRFDGLWVGTSNGVYWANEQNVYFQPVTP